MNRENELSVRLFNFAIRTIKYLRTLPNTPEYRIIKYQLIKSSTSSGANYKEAQSGYSRADFNHKVNIALNPIYAIENLLRLETSSKYIASLLF